MPSPTPEPPRRLAVDRVACTGHGVCASLLPGQVRLDEWGYPVLVDPVLVDPVLVDPVADGARAEEVELAIRRCPARALYLR